MKKLILASASPRRIEMMKKHGFEPQIIPADVDENLPLAISPAASVMYLAMKKARFVADKLCREQRNDLSGADSASALVIAADTVVVHRNRIIGKPADKDEAFATLSALRNDRHHVMTGVCIVETDGSKLLSTTCFHDDTSVYFTDYSDEELTAYVNTPEPYDKAGGYAIQQTFGKYIDHIEGDLDNVIGFPWHLIEPYLI